MPDSHPPETELKRSLSLPLITFYGLGTILGAGIYVLIGEVAGAAGMQAPAGFLLAAIIAGFTALSYGELASRIPRSAGEAAYAEAAFHNRLPAALAGYGVILTGIVSAATILNGFVGYLNEFIPAHRELTILVAVLAMTALAAWGVTESVAAASLVTFIEIAGLVFVVVLCADSETATAFSERWAEMLPSRDSTALIGILGGAYIAFFAYVGFEDIVNMAEEVKNPERNLPRAILLSLGVATVLYMLVATLAVLVLPLDQLAGSTAPLADMIVAGGRGGAQARTIISLISLVAVINGALIQIIMASRVLYGMASPVLSTAPAFFRAVHPGRRTPTRATFAVTTVVLALALAFKTLTLALITSTITLLVFALINASLLRLKLRDRKSNAKIPLVSCPLAIPLLGLILSLAFIALQYIGLLAQHRGSRLGAKVAKERLEPAIVHDKRRGGPWKGTRAGREGVVGRAKNTHRYRKNRSTGKPGRQNAFGLANEAAPNNPQIRSPPDEVAVGTSGPDPVNPRLRKRLRQGRRPPTFPATFARPRTFPTGNPICVHSCPFVVRKPLKTSHFNLSIPHLTLAGDCAILLSPSPTKIDLDRCL